MNSFNDLIAEAQRSATALDGLSKRDAAKDKAGPIGRAKIVYGRLLEHQSVVPMTRTEATALQGMIDLIRARLHFFGEPV